MDHLEASELMRRAREVLERNWTGSFTAPSLAQYPHQWNWDAGFIVLGRAHHQQERAEWELRHLFAAQWENGKVPHIVFRPESDDDYFPDAAFWRTDVPRAPRHVRTSGLTMPPVHATAALHLHRHAADPDRSLRFLEELYPALLASHRYFHTLRDPEDEGLSFIRHPWESGTDNAPTWDAPLGRIDTIRETLPPYRRKDLRAVAEAQRPTDSDYDRYVFLLDLHRRRAWREAPASAGCPFVVQDPMLNAILCRADEDLAEIARMLGRDRGEVELLEGWRARTEAAMERKLWSEERGVYDAFDVCAGERIPMGGISGFVPLFAGVPGPERAARLVRELEGPRLRRAAEAAGEAGRDAPTWRYPSFDPGDPAFRAQNYWRGPVWLNVNWLLLEGLRRYGRHDLAREVARDSLELVRRHGFWEYFHPLRSVPDGEGGFGTRDFSWTAALVIHLLSEHSAGRRLR